MWKVDGAAIVVDEGPQGLCALETDALHEGAELQVGDCRGLSFQATTNRPQTRRFGTLLVGGSRRQPRPHAIWHCLGRSHAVTRQTNMAATMIFLW